MLCLYENFLKNQKLELEVLLEFQVLVELVFCNQLVYCLREDNVVIEVMVEMKKKYIFREINGCCFKLLKVNC